jgi:adenosine kinase
MGCVAYFTKNGKMKEKWIKRIQVDKVVDTTGCGDSFAGGLAFGYLKTKDYVQACYYANATGAQRCTGTELKIYKSLKETEEQIAETYAD